MRNVLSAFAAIILTPSIAISDPLPPGKPAGVHHAVSETEELAIIAIGGLAVIGLGVAIFKFDKSATSTTGTAV
jgi:hypothetical protein